VKWKDPACKSRRKSASLNFKRKYMDVITNWKNVVFLVKRLIFIDRVDITATGMICDNNPPWLIDILVV